MPQGWLHPAKIVTGALGGAWLGGMRRWVVKRLYTHLARAYPLPEWTTMNYGYVPTIGATVPPVPADSAERLGLNLYWRVATAGRRGAALSGLDIVEIGSGRGGGAATEFSPCSMPTSKSKAMSIPFACHGRAVKSLSST